MDRNDNEAFHVLRDQAQALRERADRVRAIHQYVLAEFGPAGVERLENGIHHPRPLLDYARDLDKRAQNLFDSAERVRE